MLNISSKKLILIERTQQGTVKRYALDKVLLISAQSGANYTLIEESSQKPPQGMRLKRMGAKLVIDTDHEVAVEVDDFYSDKAATFTTDGSAVPITGSNSIVTASTPAIQVISASESLVWQASDTAAAINPTFAQLGLGGVGLAALAGSGGGAAAAVAHSSYTISVIAVAGTFNSAATVDVFDKDGKFLATGHLDPVTGQFVATITTGYSGPIFVKVSDANGTGVDYLDEASNTNKSLGTPLRAMAMADGSGNIAVTVSPLTELAARSAGIASTFGDAGTTSAPITTANVATNQHIGALFGVDDITGPVVTVTEATYNEANGISAAENYGKVLAALSGVDATSGANGTAGTVGDTLTLLEAGIVNTGEGTLALEQATVDLVGAGAVAFESGANASKATVEAIVTVGTPIISEATSGLNAAEASDGTNVDVDVSNAVAGNVVTLKWGSQTVSYTLTDSDILAGVAHIPVGAGVIAAAGQGQQAVTAQIGTQTVSPAVLITVDTATPTTPTVAATVTDAVAAITGTLANNGATNDSKPTLTGTRAEAGTTVTVLDGATVLGTATVANDGSWSFTPTNALSEGPHSLTYTLTDAAGNVSGASPAVTFTIDATAPATPTTAASVADDVTPVISNVANNGFTNDNLPTISGTGAEAGTTVTVLDGATVLGTATVANDGSWSFAPTTALAEGPHSLTYTLTDAVGNTSGASPAVAFIVDATAPSLPNTAVTVADDVAPVTGNVANNGSTNDTKPTLSGTGAEVGATVTISDGNAVIGTALVADNGSWSFTPTTALTEGAHNLTYTLTDAAGNVSDVSPITTVTVDSQVNVIDTGTNYLSMSVDSGASTADYYTNDTTPQFRVHIAEAVSFQMYYQPNSWSGASPVLVDSAKFTVSGPLADIYTIDLLNNASLQDGYYTLRSTDLAGNFHDDQFTVDTSDATPVINANANHDYINTAAVAAGATFTGAAVEVDAQVINFTLSGKIKNTNIALNLSLLDRMKLSGATLDSNHQQTWTAAIPTEVLSQFKDGPLVLTMTTRDLAGNEAVQTRTFTIDTTAPATPTTVLTSDTTDNANGHNTDSVTNSAALTLSTLEANATREYSLDGGTTWSTTYTPPTIDGSYTVKVRDTDAAGNASPIASVSFTLDTTVSSPTIALTTDSTDGATGHDTDLLTNNAALTFNTAASDVTRSYKIGSDAANSSYTPPTVDGTYTVEVIDTDAAGNTGSASITFTLDTTLATPTVALTTDSTDGATGHGTDLLTNSAALTFNTAASDVTRSYKIGSDAATSSYTPPTVDGTYTVEVTDTDAAGNTGSASITFTLDTTLATPTVALTTDSTDGATDHGTDRLTNSAALTFNTAASDVTRSYKIGSGAATSSYTPPTVDGTYTVEVTDTDAAGNTASASITFTLDTTAPTAPADIALSDNVAHDLDAASGQGALASHHRTNDTTPTLSGTVEANAIVNIYNGSTLLTTLNADSSGAWSYTPSALAQGGYTLTATATDAAGNTSAASNSLSFTVDTLATATLSGMTIDSGRDGRTDLPVSTDRYTYDDTPQFNISTEAGATVFISSDTAGQNRISNGVIVTESATTPGIFDVRTTVPLPEDVYYLNAEDQAGNWTQFSSFTVDTVAQTPEIAMASVATHVLPTGTTAQLGVDLKNDWTINHDEATGNVTLTFSDIEATGEVRNVFLNGGTLAGTIYSLPLELIATQSGDHTVWTATLAPEEIALLNDGNLTLTAQHVDLAGNISTSTHAVTLDTVAPTVADTSKIEIIDNTPGMYVDQAVPTTNPIANMNDPTPTFVGAAGSVEGGSTVWIYDTFGSNPKALLGSVIAAADGSWSYTAADMSVQQGNHSITYVSTDVAGNMSTETAAQTFKLVLLPMVTAISITPVTDSNTGNDVSRPDMSVPAIPADTLITSDATQIIYATLSADLKAGEHLFGSVDGGASWVDISASVTGTALTWHATLAPGIEEVQIQSRDATNVGVVATQTTDLESHIVVDAAGAFLDSDNDGVHDAEETTLVNFAAGPQTLNSTDPLNPVQNIDLANGRVSIHFNDVPTNVLNLAGFGGDDKIEIDIQAFVANQVWMSGTESYLTYGVTVNYDLTNPFVLSGHPLTKFDLQGILPHSLAQTANGYQFAGAHAAISYAGNSPGYTKPRAKTAWVRYDANGQLLQMPYINRWGTPQTEVAGPTLANNITLSDLSKVSFVNYPDIWVGVDADGMYFDADHDGKRDVTTAYAGLGTSNAGAADLDVHANWLASGEESNITLTGVDFQNARVIMQVNDVQDSGPINLTGFGIDDRIIFNVGSLIENGALHWEAVRGVTDIGVGTSSVSNNFGVTGNRISVYDTSSFKAIMVKGGLYDASSMFANWTDANNALGNSANFYQSNPEIGLNINKSLSDMLAAPQVVDIVLPSPVHVIVDAAGQWIDANGNGVLDGTEATTHADFGLGGNASLVSKEVTIRFFDAPTTPLDLSAFNGDDKIELDMAQLYANYYDTVPLVGGGALARGIFTTGHNNPAYRSTTTNAAKVVGAEDGGIWAAGAYTGGLLALDVGGAANAINNAALATHLNINHFNPATQLTAVDFLAPPPNPAAGYDRVVIVGANGAGVHGVWIDVNEDLVLDALDTEGQVGTRYYEVIDSISGAVGGTSIFGDASVLGTDVVAYRYGGGTVTASSSDDQDVTLLGNNVLIYVKEVPTTGSLNLSGFGSNDRLLFDMTALKASGGLAAAVTQVRDITRAGAHTAKVRFGHDAALSAANVAAMTYHNDGVWGATRATSNAPVVQHNAVGSLKLNGNLIADWSASHAYLQALGNVFHRLGGTSAHALATADFAHQTYINGVPVNQGVADAWYMANSDTVLIKAVDFINATHPIA